LFPLLVVLAVTLNPIAAQRVDFGKRADAEFQSERESTHISVIQTNVPQSIKNEWTFDKAAQDFSRFLELTNEAASANPAPDLIVWPETMFPGMALNASAVAAMRDSKLGFKGSGAPLTVFHDALLEFQKELGVPMLIGAEAIEGLKFIQDASGSVKVETESRHNSAFLISRGEVQPQRYDKMHLTPFGEVMPYISEWDWLEKQLLSLGAQGMSFDLKPGTNRTVFTIDRAIGAQTQRATDFGSAKSVPDAEADADSSSPASRTPHPAPLSIVTPICFEAAVQHVCRSLVFEPGGTRRADLMICLTNDGWFYNWRGGHENHLLFARWRCLELGTPMVRAANTGISCLIDAHGRIIERRPDRRNSDQDIEGVLNLRVALPRAGTGPSLFARFGNWLGWTSLAAAAIFFVAACVPLPRRTSSPRKNPQPPTAPTP
jgi:apolipoprotein N-acyltransferase